MLDNNRDFLLIATDFPHIGRRLRDTWGTPAFLDALDDLFHDPSLGANQAFPLEVLNALHALLDLHHQTCSMLAQDMISTDTLERSADFVLIDQGFPHIGKRFRDTWGTLGFLEVMDTLFHDTRGGTRRGFPLDALMALNALQELHRDTFPNLHPTDMWDNRA